MTNEAMRAMIDGAGINACVRDIGIAKSRLLFAAEEFDGQEEYERAMAVRRALKALDEATEGLS